MIVLDTRGRLLQANDAASLILGFNPETDLVAWGAYREQAGPDSWPAVLRTGHAIRDTPLEVDRPDGTRVALLLSCSPLRDPEGAISGFVQSFRDVTGQADEHRRLAATEDRLREAHEVARLSSWEWAPDTGVVSIFHALSGEKSSPGARATLDELLEATPPEERQGTRDDLEGMVRGESDGSVRRSRREYAAGSAWLETRTRAVRDGDGRLLCVRGTTQDVTEQELSRRETVHARDFFQATLDSLAAHIAVLDDDGEILLTNRAWADFADANGSRPIGLGENYLAACDAAVGDEPATRAAAGLRAILSGSEAEFSMEYPRHSPTVDRWFALRVARFDGHGDARVVVSHEDMTERHRAEDQVAMQAALLDEVDVAVIATDGEGLVTHWNQGAERLHGWTFAEVVGKNAVELVSPPGAGEAEDFSGDLRREGQRRGEFTARRKDGSTFPAFVQGRLMGDGRSRGAIWVLVDISERVASERALVAAGNFMRAIADSMGEGLFTIDTEGRLIYMNDAGADLLGWTSADLLGRVMAPVIHSRLPDGPDLAFADCPIMRARRDRRTVRVDDDVFTHRDGGLIPVAYTASPFETDEGIEGCVVVFKDIAERKAQEERLKLEAGTLAWIGRIRSALAEDRFVLHAQPIVELRTGEVVQHELLLRMREADGELVGPAAFLGVAEEYGLIGDIDRWVIGRGAEIAATGLPVQINLSAHSIGDQSVLSHIERSIEQCGAEPSHIVFEITETAIVADAQAARVFAERLRSIGCRLALDDFGTGYGGFTYLKQLPVDCLKIDIEFVRDLATNLSSRHVVEAVVALARGFKLQTVAEGVEDAGTLELLGELGVDLAQGYHIARPGPLEPRDPPTRGGTTRE
ncbi:MAG: EAL domain-containing protein [Thermoleophilaceae bacterium]|nr:EAL domain-containing protein [Thermoleophilaceae bacterium]